MRFDFSISKQMQYKSDDELLKGSGGEKPPNEAKGYGASIQVTGITRIEDFDQIEKQLAKAKDEFKSFTYNREEIA